MTSTVDIAVVGAGVSGIAAAISAARAGRSTLLMEQRPGPGGTGGFSGITTLCGLFDDTGASLSGGFAREFADRVTDAPPVKTGRVWVLPYEPARFRTVAAELCASEPNLAALWNSGLASVEVRHGRIQRINGIAAGAVIDCSGTAEVARLIGLQCMETDPATQAPAMVFRLENVAVELQTALDAAGIMLAVSRAGLPPVSLMRSLTPNAIEVKFSGRADQVGDLVQCLRSRVPGFEKCVPPGTPPEPAQRAGRMIVGDYVLTGNDVLSGAKFPDAVARCAWPVEQWGPDGTTRVRHLPAGLCYDIPARSLHCASIANLFMAGKTISADVDAIASARVMGCCLATGEAAARLAARHHDVAGPG